MIIKIVSFPARSRHSSIHYGSYSECLALSTQVFKGHRENYQGSSAHFSRQQCSILINLSLKHQEQHNKHLELQQEPSECSVGAAYQFLILISHTALYQADKNTQVGSDSTTHSCTHTSTLLVTVLLAILSDIHTLLSCHTYYSDYKV